MNSLGCEKKAIYSTFGGDPDLADLVEMFVEAMPDRVASLRAAYANADAETLTRIAHQLKGALGSYGFGELVPMAAALEQAACEGDSMNSIEPSMLLLIEHYESIRPGVPI